MQRKIQTNYSQYLWEFQVQIRSLFCPLMAIPCLTATGSGNSNAIEFPLKVWRCSACFFVCSFFFFLFPSPPLFLLMHPLTRLILSQEASCLSDTKTNGKPLSCKEVDFFPLLVESKTLLSFIAPSAGPGTFPTNSLFQYICLLLSQRKAPTMELLPGRDASCVLWDCGKGIIIQLWYGKYFHVCRVCEF